jgi:thiamine pyrophosphokinase
METIAIILANGKIEDASNLRERLETFPMVRVFAADGGNRHSEKLGLEIEAVIGDLDSLGDDQHHRLAESGIVFETHPQTKDETDLELTLRYVQNLGFKRIILLGVLGGRLDMTIANLQLLTHPEFSTIRLEIWHGDQSAWIISPPGDDIVGTPGDTLSLIPLNGPAVNISTTNLAYPLNEETLHPGPARGISNVMTKPDVRVDLEAGTLLAVLTPGQA